VQLFVEAKRHQPSVIYIPSLAGWVGAVSETARATVHAMLGTLAPTDPILLLAVVDGAFLTLPRDVRAWFVCFRVYLCWASADAPSNCCRFGPARDARVELRAPGPSQRAAFFVPVLADAARAPPEFPDGVPRKKRVLEELPIAPPLAPRAPSAAELATQAESDGRLMTLLKFRLNPILVELKKKHKRFTKPATVRFVSALVGWVGCAGG
jgi:hypothetical protein